MFSFFYKLILALCFQKYNYNLERGSPYYYEGKITWKLKNDPGKKKKKKMILVWHIIPGKHVEEER